MYTWHRNVIINSTVIGVDVIVIIIVIHSTVIGVDVIVIIIVILLLLFTRNCELENNANRGRNRSNYRVNK